MTDTKSLRSRKWFDNLDDPEMTALYIERYLNYGLTLEELRSGKPVIGIAQTGSDLSPCNRHHIELAKRTRDGIIAAGGIPMEIPVHPIQETGKRPTAMLDRNLAYLSLVESLYGYPIDGVVLTIGCDKTTPALLMAAATVGMPALAFSVGPMLGDLAGAARAGGRHNRRRRIPRDRGLFRSLGRVLQHDGHRVDDELPVRGFGHAAARRCLYPRTLPRTRASGLSYGKTYR